VIRSRIETLRGLRVLALSPVGAYGGFNTSIHRIEALESLGCDVQVIDSSVPLHDRSGTLLQRVASKLHQMGLPVSLPDVVDDRGRLKRGARHAHWDVIWLEKSLTLDASSLREVRLACPGALIIGFSADDMNARHNQSAQWVGALPLYDCFVTTKSYNVAELQALGCPRVLFTGNGFDPGAFRPVPVTPEEAGALGGDIGFIGTYERERAEIMLLLARQGLQVRVWGGSWEKMVPHHGNLRLEQRPLYGDDFAKACASFKINLAFLRKANRDQQTTRSVEIPACGAFMLAERTSEHLGLFTEGEEAEFFSSPEELVAKCKHYLDHEADRIRVARGGLARCLQFGYSNAARLRAALVELLGVQADRGSNACQ